MSSGNRSVLKVLTVVGARPQFVKASPVSKAFRAVDIEEVIVHTGQHYDEFMSQVFFDELGLQSPARNLNVGSASHATQTAGILVGMEQAIVDYQPDWVLVYGDTNSTLAAALAAVKMHVPIAHVEAGLRSFNRRMPEEINRVLADHVADCLFAPTQTAIDNLRAENIPADSMALVGDVMYDLALSSVALAEARSAVLQNLAVESGGYIFCTIHRAENTDDEVRLLAIIKGLDRMSTCVPVIMPVHPRTAKMMKDLQIVRSPESNIRMLAPTGFLDTLQLTRHARLVVTDSGGLQKEAYFHRVPCVTLRDETEWTELVAKGCNTLVPPQSPEAVFGGIEAALFDRRLDFSELLFGDGHAAERIAAKLLSIGSSK